MNAFDTIIAITESGLRLSVPLIFACMAGLWSERSGVVDIGLEGKMLIGAFAGAAAAHATGQASIGLIAAHRYQPTRQSNRFRCCDQYARCWSLRFDW